jgi:hypothetical protein
LPPHTQAIKRTASNKYPSDSPAQLTLYNESPNAGAEKLVHNSIPQAPASAPFVRTGSRPPVEPKEVERKRKQPSTNPIPDDDLAQKVEAVRADPPCNEELADSSNLGKYLWNGFAALLEAKFRDRELEMKWKELLIGFLRIEKIRGYSPFEVRCLPTI